MFRFIFVLVAMCGMLHAAEEKPKLPVEVVQMVASYDAEVAKLKAAYDADVIKRAEVLKGKLVKAQEVVTKKGDLETALAIKATVEKLPTGPLDPTKASIGTWAVSGTNYAISVSANKSATWKSPQQEFIGSWDYDKKNNAVLITWSNGTMESITPVSQTEAVIWEESAEGKRIKKKSGTRE